jgi:hypothetical protein
VDLLILKLVLTPVLIGAASLAGRRWGPAVSGWLVGLPLTSGPIAFFLVLNEGPSFARAASIGTLAGAISQACFCLAYGWLGVRLRWPVSLLAGSVAFAASTVALRSLHLPLPALFIAVVLALIVALELMPRRPERGSPSVAVPRWDIPARMIVATAYVVLLTALAPALGPRLTGLLSPFPLYAAVLAVFAHHLQGPEAAASVLHGLLLGLFSFAAFFLVLAGLLERAGVLTAFAAAIVAALACQGGSLWRLRGRALPGPLLPK